MTKREQLKDLLKEFEIVSKKIGQLTHMSNVLDGEELDEIAEKIDSATDIKEFIVNEILELFDGLQ